jgi:hypothetical protein
VCIGCKQNEVSGSPDPKHISTSYVERANLTMRMNIRRFPRLTNAFRKKIENHEMASLLLTVAAVIVLVAISKVARTAQPGHAVPWGQLLVWAILFGGGLSIWLMATRAH